MQHLQSLRIWLSTIDQYWHKETWTNAGEGHPVTGWRSTRTRSQLLSIPTVGKKPPLGMAMLRLPTIFPLRVKNTCGTNPMAYATTVSTWLLVQRVQEMKIKNLKVRVLFYITTKRWKVCTPGGVRARKWEKDRERDRHGEKERDRQREREREKKMFAWVCVRMRSSYGMSMCLNRVRFSLYLCSNEVCPCLLLESGLHKSVEQWDLPTPVLSYPLSCHHDI